MPIHKKYLSDMLANQYIRKQWWVLLGLFLSVSSPAQERGIVKGTVIEMDTRRPIPGVNVTIRGTVIGTSTDSVGFFSVEIPIGKPAVFVFSHLAYKKVARNALLERKGEVEYRIAMEQEPIKLEEVVVTSKLPASQKTPTWHLSAVEFERLGESDMEKALRYLIPDVIKPLRERMMMDSNDFTLYVNGEWRESIFLADIDPFTVRRVQVWGGLGKDKDIDVSPIGMPLRRGTAVISIDTK